MQLFAQQPNGPDFHTPILPGGYDSFRPPTPKCPLRCEGPEDASSAMDSRTAVPESFSSLGRIIGPTLRIMGVSGPLSGTRLSWPEAAGVPDQPVSGP